ncbi:PLP-dependent aminotransferase family protein [Halioxenophilus sp. WMMB6]|uniref:aminotransferase-like domain-containing protein n=1 Tax=Halioxenophilus sp. WMMB6 TaxID=3073815 RepID=UPI00295EFA7F|nr:PLP-dependent aminotransferase family protein [Halioxenophilus sp. WMMB6]
MTIWHPPELNPEQPKYKALADAMATAIAAGELQPGQKLPTHRHLADRLGVTVGTVTRAYAEAEKRQLIESRVGSGTYVRSYNSTEFAIGEPLPEEIVDLSYSIALNVDQAGQLAEDLASLSGNRPLLKQLLNYQTPGGLLRHREAGLQWLQMTGIDSGDLERLLITNGGQHGFHTATAALCRAGDTVLSAGLTYPGFSLVAQQMGLRHIGIESDSDGVIPEALNTACLRFKPRLIYLNTRVNNPSCEQTSAERIDQLAEILQRHQVWVVEDDVQGCLLDASQPSFANRHPEITLFVSGTSKALTGGLRVGYLLPPKPLLRAAASAIRSSCWMTAPLMVEIASRWITSGVASRFIIEQQRQLTQRHALVRQVLTGLDLHSVDYGLNVWLLLPEPRRGQEFCQSLERQKVMAKPSAAFAAGHFNALQAIRFCVGGDTSLPALEKALHIIQGELQQPGPEFDIAH